MRSADKKRILIFIALTAIAAAVALYVILYTADQQPVTAESEAERTELNVAFFDVGQADCALVSLSTGETMLIDAGESSDSETICKELDERGITDIDVLIATHPHTDHIGGMQRIVEQYAIGQILMPDMVSSSKTYKSLTAAIESNGIPVIEAFAGYSFSLGEASCSVVSPDASADKDMNNESIVIFLDFYDAEFLFTGDMEKWAESAVLDAGYTVDADVLKVAHHGSATGTSEMLLAAVSPDYAVISCGINNKYGHPHPETLDRIKLSGAKLYRTDIDGEISFVSDGKGITARTGH